MENVFREIAILREKGEDVSYLIEIAREVCYRNMKIKEHPDYIDKDTDGEKERVS